MHKPIPSTIVISLTLACGSPHAVRQTSPQELRQLLEQGRRVQHSPHMSEANGFSLSGHASDVRISRVEFGHDDTVPSLLQFDTTSSPVLADEEVADFAEKWLRANADELGFSFDDLTPADRFIVRLTERIVTLSYQRANVGVPVRDAFVQVNFAVDERGLLRLREVVNRSHGRIRLENPEQDASTLDELTEALAATGMTPISKRDVIYPLEVEGLQVSMIRATEVNVHDESEDIMATLTFENGSLMPLEAYHHRYAAKVSVRASVVERSYLDPARVDLPLPLTAVNGTGLTTDRDGQLEAALNPGDTVSVRLGNARVVAVANGTNAPYNLSGSFDANQGSLLVMPDANGLVGLNAYLSVNRINSFVRRHLRAAEVPILDRSIRVTTNVDGACNAFYDGAISLFSAGDGCANMALVNDVTYHEWGHGLDDSTGRSRGIADGAFSEGIGDILSAYYTKSSQMAPGFLQGDRKGIRDLNNNFRFPDNRGGVHQEGLTIGGAFWDLRKGLIERYGETRGSYLAERMFLRHLLVTDSYRESYQSILTLDDDDANPVTPSPNKCLITAAFARHGLATEEDNCQDLAPTSPGVMLDSNIAIAVQSETASGLVLIAAGSETARTMYACLGSEKDCLVTKRQDVRFKVNGRKQRKILFVAETPFILSEQQLLTLFAADQDGKLIGKRTFLVHAK